MKEWKRYLRTGVITLALGIPASFAAYSYADTQDRMLQLIPKIQSAVSRERELVEQAKEESYKCNSKVRCPPEQGCPTFDDCSHQYNTIQKE